jgi:hypothetical protein
MILKHNLKLPYIHIAVMVNGDTRSRSIPLMASEFDILSTNARGQFFKGGLGRKIEPTQKMIRRPH